ncbi:class I SAM-dependent methyltransferase [Citrobacter koseri]|uniref:class I SAM-dependent methyltransferase n=1 Tax=Citrobacter koseri TaxID=545 RepID=UPI0023B1D42C|nr:class I SAM-dependent methyltransferase [Citrobacter koseri]
MSAKENSYSSMGRIIKKRFRSQEMDASEWLLKHISISHYNKILKVISSRPLKISTLKQSNCQITFFDIDRITILGQHKVYSSQCVADTHETGDLRLPFPDSSFDTVINEAMLTSYSNNTKNKLIMEYNRVLRPGGQLLTHELMFIHNWGGSDELLKLYKAIHVDAIPMTLSRWRILMSKCGFTQTEFNSTPLTFFLLREFIYGESIGRTQLLIQRALQTKNHTVFWHLLRQFQQIREELAYLLIRCIK